MPNKNKPTNAKVRPLQRKQPAVRPELLPIPTPRGSKATFQLSIPLTPEQQERIQEAYDKEKEHFTDTLPLAEWALNIIWDWVAVIESENFPD